MFYCVSFVATC